MIVRLGNWSGFTGRIYFLLPPQIARLMGPTWVLSAPDGPHIGPMNLAIGDAISTCTHTSFANRSLSRMVQPFVSLQIIEPSQFTHLKHLFVLNIDKLGWWNIYNFVCLLSRNWFFDSTCYIIDRSLFIIRLVSTLSQSRLAN